MSLFLDNQFPDFANVNRRALWREFNAAMRHAYQTVKDIRDNPAKPTFDNTIRALETANTEARRISSIGSMCSLSRGDAYQKFTSYTGKRLSTYGLELAQAQKLFDRVKYVREHTDTQSLSPSDRKLLDNTYDTFLYSGLNLEKEQRQRFNAIHARLAELGPIFTKNLKQAQDSTVLILQLDEDVSGIPDTSLQDMRKLAATRNLGEVYAVKAASQAARDIMDFADNRDLRRRIMEMNFSYGRDDANWEVAREMLNLRLELANIQGYPDYAHYVLAHNRMADDPQLVIDMWQDLFKIVRPAADAEIQDRKDLAFLRDTITDFQPWDGAYYARLIQEQLAGIDMNEVRQYLPVDRMIQGQFDHNRRFMDWSFVERPDLPAVVPQSTTYEVRDATGKTVGFMMNDLYEREKKRSGACIARIAARHVGKDGDVRLPVYMMFSNFQEPGGNATPLLTLDNVRTLRHENGHLSDGMSGTSDYDAQASSNAPTDSVEIASLFMENYMWAPEFTGSYMRHVETGAAMPAHIIQRLKDAEAKNLGVPTLGQLSYGTIDMALHTIRERLADVAALKALDKKIMAPFKLMPHSPDLRMVPVFNHLFGSKYASGYYSYIWSEVYAASLFAKFEEKGLYDQGLRAVFRREVLGNGAIQDPKISFTKVTGLDKPALEPYLRRNGLVPV